MIAMKFFPRDCLIFRVGLTIRQVQDIKEGELVKCFYLDCLLPIIFRQIKNKNFL